MANPFITAFDARCWIALGDENAKIALQFADIARENWERGRQLLDQAEREQLLLAKQIAARRGFDTERAEFDLWESLRAQIDEGRAA